MTSHQQQASVRRPMPFRLNLEQLRKQAKELHRAFLAQEPAALARYHRFHSKPRPLTLSEAQWIIAREVGLSNWTQLKAHVTAMQRARNHIAKHLGNLDSDVPTLHVRCGSDIRQTLRTAGFTGDFLEYSDPLCQGPVTSAPNWLEERATFLSNAYGPSIGKERTTILQELQLAEEALHQATERYPRVVLWVEHDSYDQLILARCLALFHHTQPTHLEMVTVNRYPGNERFIGLGQLPPEALLLLWQQRQKLTKEQVVAGSTVWQALQQPEPEMLWRTAEQTQTVLPYLSNAVQRHCQELPERTTGLGLTEKLVLQQLSRQSTSLSNLFHELTFSEEPLPWLGDVMLEHIVQNLSKGREPILTTNDNKLPALGDLYPLMITPLGRSILASNANWLDFSPPVRWLGGTVIEAGKPGWRWDQIAARIVYQETLHTRQLT